MVPIAVDVTRDVFVHFCFFFSSRRRHTRFDCDWSSDVCSSDLIATLGDLDQNSAKFSLSDRQVPIRVSLLEESRKSLTTLENLPVPTAGGGTVQIGRAACRGRGEISGGAGSFKKKKKKGRSTLSGAEIILICPELTRWAQSRRKIRLWRLGGTTLQRF